MQKRILFKKYLKIIQFFIIGLSYLGIPNNLYSQSDSLTVISKIELYKAPVNKFDTSNFNIFPLKTNKKKIALVLSGGGARGLAQLGVMEVLEKYGVQVDMIVGTSIGAITGGLYSSGYSPSEIIDITNNVDWKSKLALTNKYEREFLFVDQKKTQDRGFITLSLDGFRPALPTSLSSGQAISDLINIILMNARFKPRNSFKDLKIPFYAVATDLDKGKRVVLKEGNISESIKASFTYPLLYSSTRVKGMNLVDGGLTANIPVDVAKENGADLTITVNSTSPLKRSEELKDPINTADQILSITLAQLNEEQLQKSDIIITPELGFLKPTDFSNIEHIVGIGKSATELLMNRIITQIDSIEEKASDNFNNFLFNGSVYFDSKLIPDSLRKIISFEQENTFVRYVTIEKRLRDIFKLGIFKDVFAEIHNSGVRNEIVYKTINNPKLRIINLSFLKDKDELNFIYKLDFADTLSKGIFELVKNNNKSDKVNPALINKLSEIVEIYGKKNVGKISNSNKMYELYELLLGGIRKEGYSLIDIDRFYLDEKTGILDIHFSEGIISSVKISGNKKTKERVILSETDIPIEKPVQVNSLKESLGGVVGTNIFQQASMFFDFEDTTKAPSLTFNVVEKSSRNIRFSFRADNERKLQLYLDFRNENLLGTANEIGASIQGGLRDRNYQLELRSNRFFGSIFTYNLSGYYRYRNILDYNESIIDNEIKRTENGEYRDYRWGTSFLLGTQVKKFGTVFAQIVYENISREILKGTFKNESDLKLFKLKIGGRVDTEDVYPFARSGTTFNYIYESSRNQITDGITFTKLSLDLTHTISLSKSSVLKPKFAFGFADKTTPSYEFFSLGGEESFYGMLEDEMKGRQVLLASLEYRYKLPFQLFFDTYVSLRYDLGRTWDNTEDIRFKDLRHGIGFATQFDTPIGKASFSAGRMFIINKGFTSESLYWGPFSFYFSIGYNL